MQPFKTPIIDMSKILDKEPLFIFVFNSLMPYRDLEFERKIDLINKICSKLIKYGHDKKSSDIKEMYVKYYISGYLNSYSFDKIVSDGTFHSLAYEPSKKFFLEVYYANGFLVQSFYQEFQRNPFYNDETRKMYLEWLIENFTVCYKNYHKEIEE